MFPLEVNTKLNDHDLTSNILSSLHHNVSDKTMTIAWHLIETYSSFPIRSLSRKTLGLPIISLNYFITTEVNKTAPTETRKTF